MDSEPTELRHLFARLDAAIARAQVAQMEAVAIRLEAEALRKLREPMDGPAEDHIPPSWLLGARTLTRR